MRRSAFSTTIFSAKGFLGFLAAAAAGSSRRIKRRGRIFSSGFFMGCPGQGQDSYGAALAAVLNFYRPAVQAGHLADEA